MMSYKYTYPIGSMYAIYANIYHQYTPQMLAYIPYMDPMGIVMCMYIYIYINIHMQLWTHFGVHF